MRALDKFWIAYFAISIPIVLLIDLQEFYPSFIPVPPFLKTVKDNYKIDSGDPLVGGTLGGPIHMAW